MREMIEKKLTRLELEYCQAAKDLNTYLDSAYLGQEKTSVTVKVYINRFARKLIQHTEEITRLSALLLEAPEEIPKTRIVEVLEQVSALDWHPHNNDPGECMSMCPVCQALDAVVGLTSDLKGE